MVGGVRLSSAKGRRWDPSSPPQTFKPRVASRGDPDLRRTSLKRRPRSGGRRRRHPADGVLAGAEPDLVAVRIELNPEPEGPRSLPG